MTPAWKSWEIGPEDTDVLQWHRGECAMCGFEEPTVMDHCHDTGLIRGRLCRGCNFQEGQSSHERWVGWRAWDNPARALNSVVVYEWGIGDPTPVRFDSDLGFMTRAERREWWDIQIAAAGNGKEWPTPVHVDLTERRAAFERECAEALERLGSMLAPYISGESA